MPPESTPRAVQFRRTILAWFRRAARDLPWRRTRDPWAVVVSEFMLQQTQVSRVLDYYQPFLDRYPTAHRLASARPRAVREAWDGLGYYRRAANLHRLARVVVKEHGGTLPRDTAALVRLPGVGVYTAGAVACFAYERAEPAVDTNVARVLSRYFGPAPRRRGGRRVAESRRLHDLARSLQPRHGASAWRFNQALMELGALVCVARAPKCEACPVRAGCRFAARPARPRR